MSIDSKTKNEETPTVPANNVNKPAHRRAKSIAEQIAENWRALPKGEQQRWTATTKAIEDDSDFEPLHLHLEPRPLPPSADHELELDLEQFPGESRYPTYDSIENTTAWFVDDLLFAPVALPVAGPIMLPPWRRPGAFSGGLDNVSFRTIIPLPRDEEDEEAAKARCSTPEAEEHFEELKALILAHKKAEAQAQVQDATKCNASKRWRPRWTMRRGGQ